MAAKAKYAKVLRRGTGFGGTTWTEMMLGELVEEVCLDTLPGIIAKRLGDRVDSLWWYQLGHFLDDVSPSMYIGFDIEGGKPQINTIAHRVKNLYNARVEYTKAMTEANIQMQFKRLEMVSSPEVQLQEQVRVLTDAVTGKNLFKYSLFTWLGIQ